MGICISVLNCFHRPNTTIEKTYTYPDTILETDHLPLDAPLTDNIGASPSFSNNANLM